MFFCELLGFFRRLEIGTTRQSEIVGDVDKPPQPPFKKEGSGGQSEIGGTDRRILCLRG